MTSGGNILSASLWSILGEASAAVAGVVSFLVYAAFLTPSDFGVVGFCAVWTSLFQLLIDNVLRLPVVRAQESDGAVFDAAFRGNIVLAVASYLLIAIAAIPAAEMLHDRRVLFMLPIMGLGLLCSGFSATHLAIAQHRFDFGTLFRIRMFATLGSVGVGIGLALAGSAYWSLVAAGLASGFIQLVASWWTVSWRPSGSFSWVVAAPLYRFAAWTAADTSMTWAATWSGGFVLGCFRGEHDLGLYRLSEQLAVTAIGTVIYPLISVFYTAYSRSLDSPSHMRHLVERFGRVVSLLAPALTGILIVAAGPMATLLGVKWHALGQLMILSSLAHLAYSLAMPLIPYIRASGRPRAVAALRVLLVACQVPLFLIAAPLGVKELLTAALVLEIVMYFVYFFAAHKITGIPVVRLMCRQGVVVVTAAFGCLASLLLGGQLTDGPLERLLVSSILFTFWFAALVFLAERQMLVVFWQDRARWAEGGLPGWRGRLHRRDGDAGA